MPFEFTDLSLPGLILIEPKVFFDDRGFLEEEYKESVFRKAGIDVRFVQDNRSRSAKGVLRGLHFQRPPFGQAKLVRALRGAVCDVVVDLRPDSPAYLRWHKIVLSEENRRMLFLPEGFAHGILAITEEAELSYKCSAEYEPSSEAGIRWNDPDLAIEWPELEITVSAKDAALPFLRDLK